MTGREPVRRDVCATFGQADEAISRIAARQRALITRAQLLELGIGRRAIDYAIARGRFHRIHRGIYSLVPFPALPPFAAELAAILACGAAALLSHHSAAGVWGIRPVLDGDVQVTVIGKETGRRRPGIRVHRTEALDPSDIRRHQQIPITSPARTLLDIAPEISGRSLEWALDQALVKRMVSHAAVRAVLAAYPRRPGAPVLAAFLDPDRPTTLTRSHAEEHVLALLRRAGLPVPEVNARVGHYTADFLWRAQKVILEVDGYQYHHTRAAFERDHRRDTEHQLQDFVVLRTTPGLLQHKPYALLVQLATVLERRRAA